MLRQRLCALQKTVARLGCPRSSRQILHRLPRRNSHAFCSQRIDFAAATRPLIAASRVYSQAAASEVHEHTTCDTNGASQPAIVGARKLTFQEAITALEQYWAKQSGANCAILLPHNTEVQHAFYEQFRHLCKRGRTVERNLVLSKHCGQGFCWALVRPSFICAKRLQAIED